MAQFIANGIITSAIYALVAVSFSLIFSTVRFFHFAHGAVFTAGPYFMFILNRLCGASIYTSILLSVVFSVLLGCSIEKLIYLNLRRKGSSQLVMLLASLCIYIVLQNIISMIFGDETKILRSGAVEEGVKILGARVTSIQMLTVCVSVALVVAVAVLLKNTKTGKSMRAVANDIELANSVGIEGDRVILLTFALGSALAGIAGILVAVDVDMTPTMGMNALMMGVVVVIIGGVGSIPGVALGALLLGMAQHLGVWKISSQWQDAIAFIILLIFLLFRPQGFLGKKVKKVTL
ncbi:MAG: branched-chain amino acid ABC transporter permease [Deltaproteobacteria bacterium]|nr:branched-chain amino acid ABC transporter permease [Deltaproteobacteria bacterium]